VASRVMTLAIDHGAPSAVACAAPHRNLTTCAAQGCCNAHYRGAYLKVRAAAAGSSKGGSRAGTQANKRGHTVNAAAFTSQHS
jgi:hypothetical protein